MKRIKILNLKSLILFCLTISLVFFGMSLIFNLASTPVYGAATVNAWNIERVISANNPLNFYYSNTGGPITMTLNSAGNVGIGTTNPAAKLDISGGALKLGITTAPTWDTNGYLWAQSTVGNRYDGLSHQFDVGNTRTTAMTINSSGNIGIGISAPTSKFSVYDSKNTNATYTSSNITLQSVNNTVTAYNATHTAQYLTATTGGGGGVVYLTGQAIDFGPGWGGVSNGYGLLARPVIGGGQNMSNSYTIYANSPVLAGGSVIGTQMGVHIAKQTMPGVGTGYGIYQAAVEDSNFLNGPTQFANKVGIGGAPGCGAGGYSLCVYGAVYSSGGYSPSDARFKKNIKPVESGLDKVLEMRPVTYEYKRDKYPDQKFPEGKQVGFIAQEIESIVPEVVSSFRINGEDYKALEYQHLTAILAQAIKEQQSEITDLKEQSKKQQEQINKLQQDLSKLLNQ